MACAMRHCIELASALDMDRNLCEAALQSIVQYRPFNSDAKTTA